jgi:hypothetical protein
MTREGLAFVQPCRFLVQVPSPKLPALFEDFPSPDALANRIGISRRWHGSCGAAGRRIIT